MVLMGDMYARHRDFDVWKMGVVKLMAGLAAMRLLRQR